MNLGAVEEHAIPAVTNAKGEVIDDCGACARVYWFLLGAARLLYRSINEFMNLQVEI